MKVEIVNVTPQMASEWLKVNTINRPLQRTVVENAKLAYERGEYVMTHQGIAFSDTGRLLDGQHRLTALAEMPDGFSVQMMVTRGLPEEAFKAMDIGRKRSHADVLHEDRRLVEVARFLATIYTGRPNAITPQFLIPFIEWARSTHGALIDFCPTVAKVWGSAPVRAAAVVSIESGVDADYVKVVYRSMILADFAAMPPCAHVLYRSFQGGSVRASAGLDTFSRVLKIMRPENANLKQIKVIDPGVVASKVREFLISEIDGGPKKKGATQMAPKAIKRTHYRLEGV